MTKREPHGKQNPGYRVESGTDVPGQGESDYSVTTDKGQGLIICKNGNSFYTVNGSSLELVGTNIDYGSDIPAKLIDAAFGDIHLRALNGTIILEAKNIRIVGVDGSEGEVTIQGSKIVKMSAPNIEVQSSGAATIAAAQGVNIAGVYTGIHASTQTTLSSGVDADSSSILGQIIAAIKKFKDFFKSICN